jgi:hypothetical protein
MSLVLKGFDYAIFDELLKLVALIEVRPRRGVNASWAAELRRNLLSHGPVPAADLFLLVTVEQIFLWRAAGMESDLSPPTGVLSTGPLFHPYYDGARFTPATIGPEAFELLVAAWLLDLVRGGSLGGGVLAGWEELGDVGLLPALRGGQIVRAAED